VSDALIIDNVAWALSLVRELRAPAWLVDDLSGAALLGLCQAARRYDPDRGVHFRPYAARRVRGAIKDECRRFSRKPHRAAYEREPIEVGESCVSVPLDEFPFARDRPPRAEIRDEMRALLERHYGRTRRLLAMLASGMTSRQAAAVLGISTSWTSTLYREAVT
jgi:RNA polymerase sigma factor (sigma-70 family)